MSDQTDKRQQSLSWLAFVYDSAIKHGVFRPADVIVHATPEVIAKDLPKELVIRIFEVAFEAGKLTPESILGVSPPTTMVKHVAPSILWEVVRDAAIRHGIAATTSNVPKTGKTPLRNWIAEVVSAGIEREIYSAADVTRHIPPGEWVKDVPLEVVAKMIASGLTRPQFDPRLALEHLTPQVIGEFVAPHLAWALFDEGAVKSFELQAPKPASGSRPAIRPPTIPSSFSPPPPAAEAPAAPAGGHEAPAFDAGADDMVDSVESTQNN